MFQAFNNFIGYTLLCDLSGRSESVRVSDGGGRTGGTPGVTSIRCHLRIWECAGPLTTTPETSEL